MPTNGRMARARAEARPPPAFRAVIGSTLDARNAGASPNSALLSKAIPLMNATRRQSTRKSSNTGSSADVSMLTTAGAANTANITPMRHAAPATSALSTSICWIKRPRPAPNERRSDISCSRAAVRARNRFATFEPAISSISAAIAARIHSGRWNLARSGDAPVAADRTCSGVLMNCATRSGGVFGPTVRRVLTAEVRERGLQHAVHLLHRDVLLHAAKHAQRSVPAVAERGRVLHRVRQPHVRG